MTDKVDNCWVIHDGAAGNRKQAIALAEALGWGFEEKIVHPGMLAKWSAPRLPWFTKKPFGESFAEEMKNPPKYVIGCGRQGALATRMMKSVGSFAIQILDPKIPSHHWDVVIAPSHDRLQGSNVISCLGSLHDVNPSSLHAWNLRASAFQTMLSPRTLVLIGGPSGMATFNEGLIEVMFSHLEYSLAKEGGSLIICGSRRTPKAFAEKIRHRFSDSNFPVWFDESDGDNIYTSALAWADRIVLTPDSVNMISEACATKLPVYIAQPERAMGRMKIFIDHLFGIGRIKSLNKDLIAYPVTPLNTMPDVIAQLKAFIKP